MKHTILYSILEVSGATLALVVTIDMAMSILL